jgi:hypothetical protein
MGPTLVDAVSDPGREGRANEDGWGVAGRFAWIIDGATGLGDEPLLDAPSDAAWLTAVVSQTLAAKAAAVSDPGLLLAAAAEEAETRFLAERRRPPRERYEIPTCAVLVARFDADGVTTVDLGDCGLYVSAAGVIHRVGGSDTGRALEKASAQRLMAGGGGRGPEAMAHLRAVRNRANTPEGYPIIAPDAASARRARRNFLPAREGLALFVTDGFEAAVEDYGLYTGESLVASANSLGEVLAALREVERNDPNCTRFPRFKPSDDATAVTVRFGAVQEG